MTVTWRRTIDKDIGLVEIDYNRNSQRSDRFKYLYELIHLLFIYGYIYNINRYFHQNDCFYVNCFENNEQNIGVI